MCPRTPAVWFVDSVSATAEPGEAGPRGGASARAGADDTIALLVRDPGTGPRPGRMLTWRQRGRLAQHMRPAQVHRAARGAHEVGLPRLKREARGVGTRPLEGLLRRPSQRWRRAAAAGAGPELCARPASEPPGLSAPLEHPRILRCCLHFSPLPVLITAEQTRQDRCHAGCANVRRSRGTGCANVRWSRGTGCRA